MSLEVSVHFLKRILFYLIMFMCVCVGYTQMRPEGVRSPGVRLPGSGEQPDMMLGTELTAGWGSSSAGTIP